MATIHIIQGFIGAGKSTFSKKLAQEINAVRLNADERVAETFSPAEQEKNWDACFSQAVTDIWDKVAQIARSGEDVILDIGFWSKESRDYARQRAMEFGAALKQYYVFAPDDVLLDRMKRRSGPIADNNVRNFHEYRKLFEEPTAEEEFILINSSDSR